MAKYLDSTPDPTLEAPQPRKVQPTSRLSMQVNVSLKDTELFKGIIAVIGDLVIDERIPPIVRQEYVFRMIRLGNEKEQE